MPKHIRYPIFATGHLGFAGRGAAFLSLAVLFLKDASSGDESNAPHEASMVANALSQLNSSGLRALLFIVGVLLVVYGLFAVLSALYARVYPTPAPTRRIPMPKNCLERIEEEEGEEGGLGLQADSAQNQKQQLPVSTSAAAAAGDGDNGQGVDVADRKEPRGKSIKSAVSRVFGIFRRHSEKADKLLRENGTKPHATLPSLRKQAEISAAHASHVVTVGAEPEDGLVMELLSPAAVHARTSKTAAALPLPAAAATATALPAAGSDSAAAALPAAATALPAAATAAAASSASLGEAMTPALARVLAPTEAAIMLHSGSETSKQLQASAAGGHGGGGSRQSLGSSLRSSGSKHGSGVHKREGGSSKPWLRQVIEENKVVDVV